MKELVAKGAKPSSSVADFAKKLSKPRAVWLMVPAASVDSVLDSLTPVLEPGDIVIDGGNSLLPRRYSPRWRVERARESTTLIAEPAGECWAWSGDIA